VLCVFDIEFEERSSGSLYKIYHLMVKERKRESQRRSITTCEKKKRRGNGASLKKKDATYYTNYSLSEIKARSKIIFRR